MGQAEAQLALYRLADILEAECLPYAIIGAFALNEYGHKRVTVDVDLVMREDDQPSSSASTWETATRSVWPAPASYWTPCTA